ncbi:hypothetical protein QBC34DRAFT_424294 [Podospora aff. communis PSN243]|uniref:Transcription activator GCR1-like domain-containing protein n=1 Tax=Podospora aff. communis PSN243 TaxID=3040156 RepID=A0AAV9GQ93_9PEZI|nr:hypothetical protein QBC34DRAFT_424294 [Podospora aff. communis PSN243]
MMQDPKVLVDILTTLQRLESLFEDQTDRLTIIELSVRSGATSPAPPSVYRPSSALNRYSVEEMTAEYHASVSRLRNRFDSIDDDIQSERLPAGEVDDVAEWQSISVYSSRPQSQILLDGFPLPPPPPVPPKDERRPLHINTSPNEDDNLNNNNTNNSLPSAALTFLLPPHFELLPTPPLTNSTTTPTSPTTNPPPPAPRRHSTLLTTTSIITEHFNVRRPTRMYTDQNVTPDPDKPYKNWRHWIRHAPGYRVDAMKAAFRDSTVMEAGIKMKRSAGRAVKGCLRVIPSAFAWVGGRMVRAQMRRLDLSV